LTWLCAATSKTSGSRNMHFSLLPPQQSCHPSSARSVLLEVSETQSRQVGGWGIADVWQIGHGGKNRPEPSSCPSPSQTFRRRQRDQQTTTQRDAAYPFQMLVPYFFCVPGPTLPFEPAGTFSPSFSRVDERYTDEQMWRAAWQLMVVVLVGRGGSMDASSG
jgi:hypothetical protein